MCVGAGKPFKVQMLGVSGNIRPCAGNKVMISDLIARTLLNPKELPIGVVTSIIGAVAFVYIYGSSRKGR